MYSWNTLLLLQWSTCKQVTMSSAVCIMLAQIESIMHSFNCMHNIILFYWLYAMKYTTSNRLVGLIQLFLRSSVVLSLAFLFLNTSIVRASETERRPCQNLTGHISFYELVNLTISIDELIHTESTMLHIGFHAFGKQFHVQLFSSVQTFGVLPPLAKITVHSDTGVKTTSVKDLNISYFHGHLRSEVSSAHGSINGQEFDGIIRTETESYFVEPSSKYPLAVNKKCGYGQHVIYKRSDLINLEEFVKNIQYRELEVDPSKEKLLSNAQPLVRGSVPGNKTSRPWKKKRSNLHNNALYCELRAVVDHTYFRSVGGSNEIKTLQEIVYAISEADRVFRTTDFDGDGFGDNVGFILQEVTFFTSPLAPGYHMRNVGEVDSVIYLKQLSQYDFSEYCLGVAFTFRDFGGNVIGLAHKSNPDPSLSSGGLCGGPQLLEDRTFRCLNTLLVSQLIHGNLLTRDTLALTLTHELGHSFGAEHDEPFCVSEVDKPSGNFIMFKTASDGKLPNNWKFSSCSKKTIASVIANRGLCLLVPTGAICGNKIVEQGEECDCGFPDTTCQRVDSCCTPPSLLFAQDGVGCKFNPSNNHYCSPKVHLCCTSDCQVIQTSLQKICRQATDCAEESVCNGTSSSCPLPKKKKNRTPCGERSHRGICTDGVCSVSQCEVYGLVQCQCNIMTLACRLCCGCPAKDAIACLPLDWLGFQNITMYNAPGSHCLNDMGICNADNLCVL